MIYKILTGLIFIVASLSFAGWYYGVDYFTYIVNTKATIKPITSLSFLMVSLNLYAMFTNKFHIKKINTFITTLMSSWILLVMFLLLFITSFGTYFEIIKLLYSGSGYQTQYYESNGYLPSIITISLFLLISFSGFVYLFNTKKASMRISIISNLILFTSSICLISILLDVPKIYDAFNYVSTGISFPASICFLLSGIILKKISKLIKYKNEYSEKKLSN